MHETNVSEARIVLPCGVVDLDRGNIDFTDGTHGRLRGQELRVFQFLWRNTGRIIPRHEILSQVWGLGQNVITRTVDMHISMLRKKLHLGPSLRSVRGAGYLLALN